MRWAEDHPQIVVGGAEATLLAVTAVGLLLWPATTVAVIGTIAGLAAVLGLARKYARKALGWLRTQRARRQQILPSAAENQLQNVPGDQDNPPDGCPPGEQA
jgi:hypothetical protein